MKKILFVCTGNICRSPSAEAIARHKAKILKLEKKFIFDSAGIESYHEGEIPDMRAVVEGDKNNISFIGINARQIRKSDFEEFDYIFAMDKSHLQKMLEISPRHKEKIKLFLSFCEIKNSSNDEVTDPYYKDSQAFEQMFHLLEIATENLIKKLAVNL